LWAASDVAFELGDDQDDAGDLFQVLATAEPVSFREEAAGASLRASLRATDHDRVLRSPTLTDLIASSSFSEPAPGPSPIQASEDRDQSSGLASKSIHDELSPIAPKENETSGGLDEWRSSKSIISHWFKTTDFCIPSSCLSKRTVPRFDRAIYPGEK
jgi:hypothetical protein